MLENSPILLKIKLIPELSLKKDVFNILIKPKWHCLILLVRYNQFTLNIDLIKKNRFNLSYTNDFRDQINLIALFKPSFSYSK